MINKLNEETFDMKLTKRILLLITLVLTLWAVPTVYANGNVTEVLGGRYSVESREEENELYYGVKHYRDIANSSADEIAGNAAGSGGGGIGVSNQFYPQQVNFLEVPSSKEVKIVNWSTTTATKWNLNTVKTIAKDYEKNHPGWKVIGAINGDFFDINARNNLPYQTNGTSLSGGNLYKSSSGSTVGFTNDGSTNSLIGGEKVERTPNMKLAIYDENDDIIKTFDIEKRNTLPNNNETSLYFANWNADKKIDPIIVPSGNNVFVIENAIKALANSPTDFYGLGYITSTKAKSIGEGEFAIVSNNLEVQTALKIGLKVRVQYEYIGAYANVTDATGAGVTLLKNGQAPSPTDKYRHPRTMIGKKEDGTIVMAVIDGRQPESNMYGATQIEMAALMKHYGCVDAFNLDGGGSSTLIIREGNDFRVTNSPSDGRERTDANALLIVAFDPEFSIQVEPNTESIVIKSNLVNNNGHEINKVFIKLNNVEKEIVDGVVRFDNLVPNTKYIAYFIIEDNEGHKISLVTQITISTRKRMPYLRSFEIVESGNNITIKVAFIDPDKAISMSYVTFEAKDNFILSGETTIKNTTLSTIADKPLTLTSRIDLNDGNGSFDLILRNPQYNILNYLDLLILQNNIKINKLTR